VEEVTAGSGAARPAHLSSTRANAPRPWPTSFASPAPSFALGFLASSSGATSARRNPQTPEMFAPNLRQDLLDRVLFSHGFLVFGRQREDGLYLDRRA